MRKALGMVIGIGALAAAAVLVYRTAFPCQRPILYTIAAVDPRFEMTPAAFATAAAQAADVWNDAAGRLLLRQDSAGKLPVRAIYDHRQEAVRQLESLGVRLDQGQRSYNDLRTVHEDMKAAYDTQSARYEAAAATFKRDKEAFEAKVAQAEQAGITQEEYRALERERDAINGRVPALTAQYRAVEKSRAELNAVVRVINRLASSQNESIAAYQDIGDTVGREYEAGLFLRVGGRERIDVYAFSSSGELVSLLAHEFGHALGLPHLDDPKAVMYRLNESGQASLSEADKAALAQRCRL